MKKHPRLRVQLMSRKTSVDPSPQQVEQMAYCLNQVTPRPALATLPVPILVNQERRTKEEEKDQETGGKLAVKGVSYGKNERKPPCAPKPKRRFGDKKVKTKTSSHKPAASEFSN